MESGRGQREFSWLNARGPQHCIPYPELRLPPSLPDAFSAQLTSTTSWTNTLATGCREGAPPSKVPMGIPAALPSSNLPAYFFPGLTLGTTEPKREDGRIQQNKAGARRGQWSQKSKTAYCCSNLGLAPESYVLQKFHPALSVPTQQGGGGGCHWRPIYGYREGGSHHSPSMYQVPCGQPICTFNHTSCFLSYFLTNKDTESQGG